jgi:hypothetical protein
MSALKCIHKGTQLPVIQPQKTINTCRPQVDPKVMDLGDLVGSRMGFLVWEPNQYLCFLVVAPLIRTPAPPRSRPPTNPLAPEEENPADDLMLFD